MKRIITGVLALLLVLTLCACKTKVKQTAAPVEERTAEEIVRTAMNATTAANSLHMRGELQVGVTLMDGPGTERQADADSGEKAASPEKIAATVTFDADCVYAPMAMKGSLTLKLEESYSKTYTEEQTMQFCLWEQDGKTMMAYSIEPDDRWFAQSVPMANEEQSFKKYLDLFHEGIFNFTRIGEDTLNGVPVTLFTGSLDGEGCRKIFDTMKNELDGIPPITFSDELVAKLRPIEFTFAIGVDDRPVCIRVDATAFADAFIENVVGPMLGGKDQSIAIDVFTIDVYYSDFNAVGPVEPPEDYIDYFQNALSFA